MKSATKPLLLFFALPLAAAIVTSAPHARADPKDALLTPACEEALALSALPARLRKNASVYVLTARGYEKTRAGAGPFTCIVERNHPAALVPQCPDAAGADSVIPGIILKSTWSLAGMKRSERLQRFEVEVEKGRLKPPNRAGVSYMMSNYNYTWSDRHGSLVRIPPHVMFYGPDLTDEDIGGSRKAGMMDNRGVPFMISEGPHGYMVSMVERASDSADVTAACRGQLPVVQVTLGEPTSQKP